MRLFLLTALTMAAFAANSVLNRAALSAETIGAIPVGKIRLTAGAGMLVLLALVLRRGLTRGGAGRGQGRRLVLCIYGFSAAYRALDAGLGALILFGTVQITMFAGSLAGGMVLLGEALTPRSVIASVAVHGGVGLSVFAPQRRIGSSGS